MDTLSSPDHPADIKEDITIDINNADSSNSFSYSDKSSHINKRARREYVNDDSRSVSVFEHYFLNIFLVFNINRKIIN